jgi:hypothetical protein
MPGQYPSHGVAVSFGGVLIGWIDDFDWEAVAAQIVNRTNVTSRVVGTGANARVVQEYDCTAIDPPTFDVAFWGPPSYSADDAGMKATLEFTAPGATYTGEAILRSFGFSGKAKTYSRGRASFQMTGA